MQILLINSHQHTFNSVRIPVGQWHVYVHAIFAHELHGLSQKLACLQDEYGFSWWYSEAARIKALLEQDNFLQPSRQINYWRTMPYHHSVVNRKQQYSTIALNAIATEPNTIAEQLAKLKNIIDTAKQHHQAILDHAPGTYELWSWKSAGNAVQLEQSIALMTLPAHNYFVACVIINATPIAEFESL